MLEQHINILISLSLSPSLLSLHPQTSSFFPVRPSLTSSAKKSSQSSRHFSKIDDTNCVASSKGGNEKLDVEARITNSAPSSTSTRSPSLYKSRRSPQKHKKERNHTSVRVSVDFGYQQPTVSSRTRALSPYTHRKMCQLSEDARQRLSHLQLGPHHFRKEIESQPPFLVGNTRYIPLN